MWELHLNFGNRTCVKRSLLPRKIQSGRVTKEAIHKDQRVRGIHDHCGQAHHQEEVCPDSVNPLRMVRPITRGLLHLTGQSGRGKYLDGFTITLNQCAGWPMWTA